MRGQASRLGCAEPYAGYAGAVLRLADWAIDKTGESSPAKMADFFEVTWSSHSEPVRNVLELCCGNGRVLHVLAERGFAVSGLDRSSSMLAQAREKLGPEVELIHAELPSVPARRQFDAVVCPAGSLNYMSRESDLGQTFAEVGRVLPSGRTFVFDLLSRYMLKEVFGNRNWSVDLDDVAAIWRFESDDRTNYCDYNYVVFTRNESTETYRADRETHRLYAFDRDVIRRLAVAAGFAEAHVYDNNTTRPASAETEYETWVLVRR